MMVFFYSCALSLYLLFLRTLLPVPHGRVRSALLCFSSLYRIIRSAWFWFLSALYGVSTLPHEKTVRAYRTATLSKVTAFSVSEKTSSSFCLFLFSFPFFFVLFFLFHFLCFRSVRIYRFSRRLSLPAGVFRTSVPCSPKRFRTLISVPHGLCSMLSPVLQGTKSFPHRKMVRTYRTATPSEERR